MRLRLQFSLRFLLFAIAVIAAITAVVCQLLPHEWKWTVAKVERLVAAEFKPDWDSEQTLSWLQSKGFRAYYLGGRSEQVKEALVRGWFGPEHGAHVDSFKHGYIVADF